MGAEMSTEAGGNVSEQTNNVVYDVPKSVEPIQSLESAQAPPPTPELVQPPPSTPVSSDNPKESSKPIIDPVIEPIVEQTIIKQSSEIPVVATPIKIPVVSKEDIEQLKQMEQLGQFEKLERPVEPTRTQSESSEIAGQYDDLPELEYDDTPLKMPVQKEVSTIGIQKDNTDKLDNFNGYLKGFEEGLKEKDGKNNERIKKINNDHEQEIIDLINKSEKQQEEFKLSLDSVNSLHAYEIETLKKKHQQEMADNEKNLRAAYKLVNENEKKEVSDMLSKRYKDNVAEEKQALTNTINKLRIEISNCRSLYDVKVLENATLQDNYQLGIKELKKTYCSEIEDLKRELKNVYCRSTEMKNANAKEIEELKATVKELTADRHEYGTTCVTTYNFTQKLEHDLKEAKTLAETYAKEIEELKASVEEFTAERRECGLLNMASCNSFRILQHELKESKKLTETYADQIKQKLEKAINNNDSAIEIEYLQQQLEDAETKRNNFIKKIEQKHSEELKNKYDNEIADLKKKLEEFDNNKESKIKELRQKYIGKIVDGYSVHFRNVRSDIFRAQKAVEDQAIEENKEAEEELKNKYDNEIADLKKQVDEINNNKESKIKELRQKRIGKIIDGYSVHFRNVRSDIFRAQKAVEDQAIEENKEAEEEIKNKYDNEIADLKKKVDEINNKKESNIQEIRQKRIEDIKNEYIIEINDLKTQLENYPMMIRTDETEGGIIDGVRYNNREELIQKYEDELSDLKQQLESLEKTRQSKIEILQQKHIKEVRDEYSEKYRNFMSKIHKVQGDIKEEDIDQIKKDVEKEIELEFRQAFEDFTGQLEGLTKYREDDINKIKQQHSKEIRGEYNEKYCNFISKIRNVQGSIKEQDIDQIKKDVEKEIELEFRQAFEDFTHQLEDLTKQKENEINKIRQQYMEEVRSKHSEEITELQSKINEVNFTDKSIDRIKNTIEEEVVDEVKNEIEGLKYQLEQAKKKKELYGKTFKKNYSDTVRKHYIKEKAYLELKINEATIISDEDNNKLKEEVEEEAKNLFSSEIKTMNRQLDEANEMTQKLNQQYATQKLNEMKNEYLEEIKELKEQLINANKDSQRLETEMRIIKNSLESTSSKLNNATQYTEELKKIHKKEIENLILDYQNVTYNDDKPEEKSEHVKEPSIKEKEN